MKEVNNLNRVIYVNNVFMCSGLCNHIFKSLPSRILNNELNRQFIKFFGISYKFLVVDKIKFNENKV